MGEVKGEGETRYRQDCFCTSCIAMTVIYCPSIGIDGFRYHFTHPTAALAKARAIGVCVIIENDGRYCVELFDS